MKESDNIETPQPVAEMAVNADPIKPLSTWRHWLTWILRIAVGALFVFSGFVKAVDPWGTLFKVDDYLAVMGISVWPNLELVAVFGLCALEFLIGVFLIFGCFRKSTPIVAALVMAFMLILSLWIALSDPVADCGCFGDAYVISNWATFWKNVALCLGVIWLLRYNRLEICIITPAFQWIAFVATAIFIVVIELFGYLSQPLIDFRPYKVGLDLVDAESVSDATPDFIFIYEKDGKREEFGLSDSLPDESDGWIFVDRKEIYPDVDKKKEENASGRSLRIWSKDGSEDVTSEAILSEGKQLIVMMPVLKSVSPATTWKLNSLYEWSVRNNVEMIAVVYGSPEEIANWEDLSLASYPIYTAEDTQQKEVVRGNPGVVYLEDGKVMWKSTLLATNIDDFLSPETSHDARTFSFDNARVLRNCIYIYLMVMGVLIVFSFTPRLKDVYGSHLRHHHS